MLVTRFVYAIRWLLAAGAPFAQVSPYEWRQSNLSASDLRLSVPQQYTVSYSLVVQVDNNASRRGAKAQQLSAWERGV
jgi:hypothetical protein